MYAIIQRHKRSAKGFTLVETLFATLVALYVLASVWVVYMITWTWSAKVYPETRAEGIARATVSNIIYGLIDSTAGTDTIGTGTYKRRNGIAWARFDPDNTPPNTPAIYRADGTRVTYGYDSDTGYGADQIGTRIDFQLEADSSNVRQFYLGAGLNAVFYKNSLNQTVKIDTTSGLINAVDPLNPQPSLEISYYAYLDNTQNPPVEVTDYNIIRVAAYVVEKAKGTPDYVTIRYVDYIHLKNSL